MLEDRRLLSADVFLQGTAFVDADLTGTLSPTNPYLAGARIDLYTADGVNLLGFAITDGSGRYQFDDSNVTAGLNAGQQYLLVNESASGFRGDSTQIQSPLTVATQATPHSILAMPLDPANLQVDANVAGLLGYVDVGTGTNSPLSVYGDLAGKVDLNALLAAQFRISVTPPGTFVNTFCLQLNSEFNLADNVYPVVPATSPLALAGIPTYNGGRIAYLYNHYGTGIVDNEHAAALQVAMWELEYDQDPGSDQASQANDLATGNVQFTSSDTTLLNLVQGYLNESVNKNETALFINPPPSLTSGVGYQAVIASGSLDFGNVPKASPSIATAASETANGVVGSALLSDSVVVSGGNNPTGTVTFTLTQPDGTTVPAGSAPINGDNTCNSPPVLATQLGTYIWHARYTGDSLNNGAADNGANESLTTVKASPSIATSASETANGVVGSALLSDSATITGGYNVTGGTITFTLTPPAGPAVTQTVTVTGTGAYSATPVLATQVGTYIWSASYSGDGLNNGAIDNGVGESAITVKASPSISTVTGGVVTVGSATISGVKYKDLTGNGFSADDTPQGGVTINLYRDTNGIAGLQAGGGGDLLVGTTMTASDGTYSFSISGAGTYYVQESVPPGNIQTGGGANGSVGNTYYAVVADSGFSYSGYNFDDFQVPICTPASVTYCITHNGYTSTVSDLAGNTHPGDTVKVTFTVPAGMSDELTLVSYSAPGAGWSDATAYQQLIYQQDTGIFTPGTHSLTVTIPNSYYQIDFICGQAIDQLEPSQNGNAYGPDSAEILYHAEQRFISSDSGGCSAPSQLNSHSPSAPVPTSTPISSAQTLTDSATLTGGYHLTGAITFYLFAPGTTPSSDYSNNVYSDAVAVTGNGAVSGAYSPTIAGTYQWLAIYSGDANNNAVASTFGDEPETFNGPPISISGTKFLDKSGNGFSVEDPGLGGVTVKLYKDVGGDGKLTSADGPAIASAMTASDGSYKFSNLSPATYFVQEVVPSGFIQTGGGPDGTAGATYYTVAAQSGHAYSGNNFDDAETCDLSKVTCVSYVINGCMTVTDLRGHTHQGDTVKVTFTYIGSGPHDFNLVSYTAPGASFDANTAYLQQIYQDSSITVPGPGKYSLTVTIPNCFYQIDFVCGDAIDQLGPSGSGPDRANIFYTPQGRLISADNGGTCSTPAVDNGDFATIGFWHNRNGQALIQKLNGGSSSTALAQWLVGSFPNLYGAAAGATSLASTDSQGLHYFTNAQIAAKYLTAAFFRAPGQKTNAQILAAALAVYATDTNLAGGNYAAAYGFNTSLLGVGIDTYKLGANGAAFGESNYATVTVFELLQDVNAEAGSNGNLSSSLANAANAAFSSINQTGDITLLATGSGLAVGNSQLVLSPDVIASGEIWVNINGLDSTLGIEQQASIDAGIASLNAQLGKYGIALLDVTGVSGEAETADIDITLADTTVIGGVAEGVLGVTLFGGDVTLVNGWNWYYGADPTLIAFDQFDFQTVATHELGHAIGLGHSADAASVMFPYLSSGEARRTLSASDLSTIDAAKDAAAEPLLVGVSPGPALQYAAGELSVSSTPLASDFSVNGGATFAFSTFASGPSSPGLSSSIVSLARRRLLFDDRLAIEDLPSKSDIPVDDAGPDWGGAISAHAEARGLGQLELGSRATKSRSLAHVSGHAAPSIDFRARVAQEVLAKGTHSPAAEKSAVDALFGSEMRFGSEALFRSDAVLSLRRAGNGPSVLAKHFPLPGSSAWSASALEAGKLEDAAWELGSECAETAESLYRAVVDALLTIVGS